jgi:hypothetical protein
MMVGLWEVVWRSRGSVAVGSGELGGVWRAGALCGGGNRQGCVFFASGDAGSGSCGFGDGEGCMRTGGGRGYGLGVTARLGTTLTAQPRGVAHSSICATPTGLHVSWQVIAIH